MNPSWVAVPECRSFRKPSCLTSTFHQSVMLLIYCSEFCSPCLIIIYDCVVVWNVGILPVHWLQRRLWQFTLRHVLLHGDHLHLVLSFNLLYLLLQHFIFLMHTREVLLCYGDLKHLRLVSSIKSSKNLKLLAILPIHAGDVIVYL